jgi:hypothetical protein
MTTLTLTNLAPGRTASIQLYVRETLTAVGSPITGTSIGYTYSFANVPDGEYDCVLIGFTDPVGDPFPVRDGLAYIGLNWSIVDMITLVDAVVVANVTQPTAARERLVDPIIIGDDYLESVGRNFEWQVNAIVGYAAAELTCKFGGIKDGLGWLVTGTVSTITGGLALKFDLPKTATQDLEHGLYAWSVEVSTIVDNIEVTRVVGKEPVRLIEKQT